LNRGLVKRINRLTQKVKLLEKEIKPKDTKKYKDTEEKINDNNKK